MFEPESNSLPRWDIVPRGNNMTLTGAIPCTAGGVTGNGSSAPIPFAASKMVRARVHKRNRDQHGGEREDADVVRHRRRHWRDRIPGSAISLTTRARRREIAAI